MSKHSVVAQTYFCIAPIRGISWRARYGNCFRSHRISRAKSASPACPQPERLSLRAEFEATRDEQGKWTDYWAADSLQAYVTGLYRAAGTNGTSHSGRRTFATRLLRNGATIEQVQLLLGHQDIDQTSRYIDVSLADASRAFAEVV
ncbi:site-specific integrase [Caballeronia udeis]|uniref:site-specific integrase n=1 Tax=Caballeronia udeis TaxID=1232866 RepID=UPI001E549E26|nr:site-specific integrase [Caballeronia udeis]